MQGILAGYEKPNAKRDLGSKATIIGEEAEALKIVSWTQNYFLRRGYGVICMMLLSTNANKLNIKIVKLTNTVTMTFVRCG